MQNDFLLSLFGCEIMEIFDYSMCNLFLYCMSTIAIKSNGIDPTDIRLEWDSSMDATWKTLFFLIYVSRENAKNLYGPMCL